MRVTEIDRRVAVMANRQYGAFNRTQGFRIGVTDRMIRRRTETGDWLRPCPGVYVLASAPSTWLQRCKISELSTPDAAIGGMAAAAVHKFEGFGQCRPEIVVPAHSNHSSPIALCHRYSGVKLTTVKGLKVTTIAQTLFDVSIMGNPMKVERALDQQLAARQVDIATLDERSQFYAGRRRAGTNVIEPLLAERRENGWAPPTTALEAELYRMLDRLPNRPRIDRQADAPWWSVQPGRVDALLPEHRLIIEGDGRRWHSRVADFERDRWRDNLATANGYRVMRFTWVHLHHFADAALELTGQALQPLAA